MTTDQDHAFMQQALGLAARGLYSTQPNPHVGAVLVRDGVVLGGGHHAVAGGPHAEVAALDAARHRGVDVRGATLYVNLEPCNHQGRTPPCTAAIIAAGIARVVYAIDDPNPVAHHGAAVLRAAGVMVDRGVAASDALDLNIGFVTLMTTGLPWVRVKVAASLDGRTALANGQSQWITGAAARDDGHAWRARAGAILTGAGTVTQDDPQMTVRAVATPRQPLRVVVDRRGETPPHARVLAGGNVLVVTAGAQRPPAWPAAVEVLDLPDAHGRVDLGALLRRLGERGINELHVEAGARLNGALLAAGLVDEWLAYVAPTLLGDPALGMAALGAGIGTLAERAELRFHAVDRVGDDLRILARKRGQAH